MTPKSNAKSIIDESLLRGVPIHDTARQGNAALAISYHDDDEDGGDAMAADMTSHFGAALYATNPTGLLKWQSRPKVCFNILRPFVSAMCGLYKRPVRYAWSEEDDPAGKWADLFAQFKDEHIAMMADCLKYAILGGTAGARPIVVRDKGPVRYALYTGDQMEATPDAVEKAIPGQLVVSWSNGGQAASTTTRHFWTDAGFFATVDGTPSFDEWESKWYPNGAHPYERIPVVLFHAQRPRWSCFAQPPMDLVRVNRAINKKATDLDWRMTLAGDILVTDSWTEATPPVVGAGAHIGLPKGGLASFIGPDPRVQDAIATINHYLSMALMSRRIPESAIMAQQSGESGIKVVADSAALSDFDSENANLFRGPEADLIQLALFTQALHSGERLKLSDVPKPSISYTIPKRPMDAERMADWDRRIRLGIATVVDELMEIEPSLSREEAEERIETNLALQRERNAAPVFDRKQMTDEDADNADE